MPWMKATAGLDQRNALRASLWACWLLAAASFNPMPIEARAAQLQLPRLFPDYAGVTVPPNIAPLNCRILEPATACRVEMRSTHGPPITVSSPDRVIRIPPKAWASLLRANPGQPLYWDIAANTAGAGWTQFATLTNWIARAESDGWRVYSRQTPFFNYYTQLSIDQRDLASFREDRILEKGTLDGCFNCHTPLSRSPESFALNLRAWAGQCPTLLVISNQVARVDKTMGYLAWHPSGTLLAFSANKFFLFFHSRPHGETRDVYDASSDLGVYRLDSNTVVFPPPIAASDRNETWPAWAPDGRFLYFCSAGPQPRERFSAIRYDLMRASFDLETGEWGQPETVLSAAEAGLSICQPNVSPDGRWLLATVARYGSFPIHDSTSDLHVMDLAGRTWRRLAINSDEADTWHSWSGNSRWVVFSTKRWDGLFARPHFSYVSERGEFHKPFVLPQEDPAFYGFCLDTFNVPEFMRGPVSLEERDLVRAILKPSRVLTPLGPSGPTSPASLPGEDHSGYPPAR